MMHPKHDGDAARGEALEQPAVPHGPVVVERRRDDLADDRGQLPVTAGAGDRDVMQVIVEVEPSIFDP